MLFWLTLPFLFSQIFAGIALILSVLSFQFKDRKYILICLIISAFCIALQYILLERYVWAAFVGIGFIRYLTSYYTSKQYFIPIFISVFWLLTIFLWKDIYDILPLLSASINTIWAFQKDDKKLRIIMLFGAPLLIWYYFLIGSPVWILLEWMFLISNFIWYYRHYLKKKKKD